MTATNLQALKDLAIHSINVTGVHQSAVQYFNGLEMTPEEKEVQTKKFAKIYGECVDVLQSLLGFLVKPDPKAKK